MLNNGIFLKRISYILLGAAFVLIFAANAKSADIASLKQAVEADENNYTSLVKLAKAYDNESRNEEAITYYNRALSVDDSDKSLYFRLGKLYDKIGASSASEEFYSTYLSHRPSDINGVKELAGIYVKQGKWNSVFAMIEKGLKESPTDKGLLFFKAEAYKKTGKAHLSENCYREILKSDPDNKKALNELYNYYKRNNKTAEMAVILETLFELDKEKEKLFTEYIESLKKMRHFSKAARAYESKFGDSPSYKQALKIASLYKLAGNRRGLFKIYTKITAIASSDINAWIFLAEYNKENNDIAGYAEAAVNILRIDKDGEFIYTIASMENKLLTKTSDMNVVRTLSAYYRKTKNTEKLKKILASAVELDPVNSDIRAELGNLYYDSGNKEAALKEYQMAVKNGEGSAVAYARLGLISEEEGNTDQAMVYFEKASLADPRLSDILFRLGSMYLKAGREDDALKAFRSAAENKPDRGDVYLELAKLQEKMKNFKSAADNYETAVLYFPEDNTLRLKLANIASKAYKYSLAREQYEKILQNDPNNVIARKKAGLICFDEKNFKKAAEHLEAALKYAPADAEISRKLGDALFFSGNYKEAVPVLNRLFMKNSDDIELKRMLAVSYSALNQNDLALQHYIEINKKQPALIREDEAAAKIFFNAGRYEDAKRILMMLSSKNPGNAEYSFMLGKIHEEKFPGEAIVFYEKAAGLKYESPELYLTLGKLYLLMDKSDAALRSLENQRDSHPEDKRVYKYLFRLYKDRNQMAELKLTLGKLLTQYPENVEYLREYGRICIDEKNWASALKVLARADRNSKNNSEVSLMLAETYEQLRNYKYAGMYYRKAAKYDPANFIINRKYGELLYRLRSYSSAADEFEKVVKRSPKEIDVVRKLLKIYKITGPRQKWEKSVQMLAALDPNSFDARKSIAVRLYENKDFRGALMEFEKLLTLKSDDSFILLKTAECRRETGDNKGALEAYKASYEIKENAPVLKEIAKIQYELGMKGESAKSWEKYFAKNRRSREAVTALMTIYSENRKKSKIEEMLPYAVKNCPENIEYKIDYAEILTEKGEFKSAVSYLKTSVGAKPGNLKAVSLYGKVLLELKYYKGALYYLRKAAKLAPADLDIRQNYAFALLNTGNMKTSIKEFEYVLEKGRNAEENARKLAWLYKRYGMKEELFNLYKKQYAFFKGKREIHLFMGEVYSSKNMVNDAVYEYETLYRIDKNDLTAMKKLSALYKKQKKTEMAIHMLMNIAKLEVRNDQAYFELGEMFLTDHNMTLAMGEFKNCLRINPKHKLAHLKLGEIFYKLRENSSEYENKAIQHYSNFAKLGGDRNEIPEKLRKDLR